MTNKERRRFFRIDDEVNLYYRKVDENSPTKVDRISEQLLSNCSLTSALEMVSQEARPLLVRIEKDNPEIAQYLKLIDTKIDLVSQAVMMQRSDLEETESRNVNLSASGLAFDSEEKLESGTYLEIKLLLLSCMAVIVTYAKVIYCQPWMQPEPGRAFRIGVDYVSIAEQDRELLIKHIVKRQMQLIRETRQTDSGSEASEA